jgi:hypothetical protein
MGDKKYKFLDNCTYDELKILEKELEQTLESRRDGRFRELVKKVCDAWDALRSEFPTVKVHDCCGYCPQCDEWHEVDLDGDQVFVPEDFSR